MMGDRKPVTLLTGNFNIMFPRFSPDTRWVAFQTNETGVDQIYVTSFPDARGRWQVSVDGGAEPHWSGDGKQLFFISGDRIMSTDVSVSGESIRFSTPKSLLVSQAAPVNGRYDVTADGKLFAVTQVGSESPVLQLVTGWVKR